jgi:hypothetical protein
LRFGYTISEAQRAVPLGLERRSLARIEEPPPVIHAPASRFPI